MKKVEKKYPKLLVSFDTDENYNLVSRALTALSKVRNQGKGSIAQHAIEKEILPQIPQVREWLNEYCVGETSVLSILASFFKTAARDINRGMYRPNCRPIAEAAYDYLHHYCKKEPIDLPDHLWPKEAMTLIVQNWDSEEGSALTYQKIASMLEEQDKAEDMKKQTLPDEDLFAFPFFLTLDKVMTAWKDEKEMRRLMRETEREEIRIPINHKRDILVMPNSPSYILLNPTDTDSSTHATVVSVKNRGTLDIPFYIFLTTKTTDKFTKTELKKLDDLISVVCPDYKKALEQRANDKKPDEDTSFEELYNAVEIGYFNAQEPYAQSIPNMPKFPVEIIRGENPED